MGATLERGELVMVNFMSQLDQVKDTQITGKTLFLVVSVRVYIDKGNI